MNLIDPSRFELAQHLGRMRRDEMVFGRRIDCLDGHQAIDVQRTDDGEEWWLIRGPNMPVVAPGDDVPEVRLTDDGRGGFVIEVVATVAEKAGKTVDKVKDAAKGAAVSLFGLGGAASDDEASDDGGSAEASGDDSAAEGEAAA